MKTSFTKKELQKYLNQRSKHQNYGIRTLFVPPLVTDKNLDQVSEIYGQLIGNNYETAVIIEPVQGDLDKKIPMPSASEFKTPFGVVPVNEEMRNEFCDEDDDFFIDDSGLHGNMSLYDHLAMMQCAKEDFNAVSIQLADERLEIVDEMIYVLRELLAGRNVILICACNLSINHIEEFKRVKEILDSNEISSLKNYLYSGQSKIEGMGVFLTGVCVANAWELDIEFLNGDYRKREGSSLIAGYAGFHPPEI
ncbi:MAG: AmmeMemoRadiSam system protein B [Balneolales bacterium]